MPPHPGFVVSPTSIRVGRKVTFSGVGCPARDRVIFGVGFGGATAGTLSIVTPRKDGSWSKTVLVADATIVGDQSAIAECVDAIHHGVIFGYVPFGVTVTTFRRLYVQPEAPVRPGTVLTLTQSGGCPGAPFGGPEVYVTDGSTNIVSAWTLFSAETAGNWSGQITIPSNTPRGPYTLSVTCAGPSRSANAFYPAVAIAVR